MHRFLSGNRLRIGIATIIVVCSLSACGPQLELDEMSASSELSACNPPDTYDFYAGSQSYPSGPASAAFPWRGEDFEAYGDNAVVECSTARSARSHLEVTSGCLEERTLSGTYRRGYSSDYNFRALAVGLVNGVRIKWTDQVAEYRGNIKAWHSTAPDTAGLHIFVRYRTENDLYVGSYRKDGYLVIKRKWCGEYVELAKTFVGVPQFARWYRLRFSAVGDQLSLALDGVTRLNVRDQTFSWGTTGIRTDFADVYLDDWKLVY